MQHLRAVVQNILKRLETVSDKSVQVQLMRDDSLSASAILQLAHDGSGTLSPRPEEL